MKKIIALLSLVVLLAGLVFPLFGAEDLSPSPNGRGMHNSPNGRVNPLRMPGKEPLTYPMAKGMGGVLFQATAEPAGRALGLPSLSYDAGKPDGQRLSVTIGNVMIDPGLWDWEIIPVARYSTDTQVYGCVSLFGDFQTLSEKRLNKKYKNEGKVLFPVLFHEFLGNSLAGFNLFLVDTIFVNFDMAGVTGGLPELIPNYNAADWFLGFDPEALTGWQDLSRRSREIIEDEISAAYWDSYIFTDYGERITYNVVNGKLVFDGHPNYVFVEFDDYRESISLPDELNKYIKDNYETVKAINPVVYGTAEKTAQWAAFFRAVREKNPASWSGFMNQIAGKNPEPFVTPSVWTPDY
jgi:hypothetical protein